MVDFTYLAYNSWLILLFPLAGFLITALGKRFLNGRSAGIIASLAVFLSFAFAVALFISQKSSVNPSLCITYGDWLRVGKLQIPFELLIDPLSIIMMLVVTGVGFLIHVYSIGYMSDDEGIVSFFSYMNLFTFSMLLLVMGANFIILFMGWEGVGLCSYLLIGFWFKNNAFNLAARKAFIMNRIGDLGFLLGIILLFYTFQSVSYFEIFGRLSTFPQGNIVITLITILLLIGALGKSAQIPLYTWLPDAMAGPTPVSALIHAATMVTAGIYMIARSSQLFVLAPLTMGIIVIIGLTTAIFAATIGLFQNDIKKVLAYSTVSQLGYMFLALGVGAFSGAVFHLMTHAFFKALLFLGAGSVIHALHGQQDIRNMGGLKKVMPYTYWTFLIATLAISGIPPFSGFFSKDEILIRAFAYNPWIYMGALLGALMTCFYMFRLFFLVFHGGFRGTDAEAHHMHESPRVMTWPLVVLAFLSFFGGFLNLPHLFGGSEKLSLFLWPSIGILNHSALMQIPESTELYLIISSLFLLGLIVLAAFLIYLKKKSVPTADDIQKNFFYRLVYNKYYVDEIYNTLFVRPFEWLSSFLFERIERGIIDPLVNGAGMLALETGNLVRKLQTGSIGFYLFAMIAGILFFLLLNLSFF
ncbi:MAG: NADH-quinone oxidoreductase subunit L [Bacteroidota bacterium]